MPTDFLFSDIGFFVTLKSGYFHDFQYNCFSYHEEMNFLIRHILHVLHLRSSQFPIICLLYEPSLFLHCSSLSLFSAISY